MRALTAGVVALLVAGSPAAAGAQSSSKLAIGSIRGESAAVRRQILLQVCGPYQCVAASRYTSDDRPDPDKLAAGGVAGYLGGAVTGTRPDRRVILTLTTPTTSARKPARTWRLRLSPDGRLRPQVLERFTVELDDLLQASAAQLPPPPAAPPQRARPKAPPQPPPAAKPPPTPPPEVKPPPPPARPPPDAEERPRSRPEPREREEREERAPHTGGVRFAAEAGLWLTGRKLTFSGASGGNLRTYDASAVFVPSLRLEAYAAAVGVTDRFLSGLGLYVDYGRSVGLKVKPPAEDTEGNRDGTLTSLDGGLVWRLRPISGSRFALAPAVGYRSLQVVTSPEIAGLPDARLSGFEARVDLDAPVGDDVRLVGGGGYTLWTQAKDLVKGDGFYGKGSARGLSLEGGFLYRVAGPLHVRAMVTYQKTSYSGLDAPASTELGTASGATESYFGGRVMARGEF